MVVRPNTPTYLTTVLRAESQEILRIGLRMTTRACLAVTPRELPLWCCGRPDSVQMRRSETSATPLSHWR